MLICCFCAEKRLLVGLRDLGVSKAIIMPVHDPAINRRPRHQQAAITIRSDKAAELLARLTRTGRSQAEVIEAALESVPLPQPKRTREERLARIQALVATFKPDPSFTMAQFDAETYDENGLPR